MDIIEAGPVPDGFPIYQPTPLPNSNHTQPNATEYSAIYMGPIEAAIATLVWIVILLTASVGNIMVIVAIFTHPALYIVQNFLLVSLALADILVAVLVMPFSITTTLIGHWIFGREFCLFHVTCDVLLCTASILHLVAIALDRFFAIHYPIKYAQTRNLALVLGMIAAAWIISALISIPPLIGWNDMNEDESNCGYVDEKGYIIYSALGSFYIPLVILITVYLTIFISARKRLRRRAANAGPSYVMASAPTTPQGNKTSVIAVDAASVDSPDKSENGSGAVVLMSPGNPEPHMSPAQIQRHVLAEHRRSHRRLLIFPLQKRCTLCMLTQNRLLKETSQTASSFQVIDADDMSTLSPIVDLTSNKQGVQGGIQMPLLRNHYHSEMSEDSLTPTTPGGDSPPIMNGSPSKRPGKATSSSTSRLLVPKKERAKIHSPLPGRVKAAAKNSVPGTKIQTKLTPTGHEPVDVKQSLTQRQKISLTKERRAARTLLIVVLVFVICWLPFFMWYLIRPFCPNCPMDDRTSNFFLWLGFLNSSLNPVIYTIFNLDFRKAFKRIFKRIFPARK